MLTSSATATIPPVASVRDLTVAASCIHTAPMPTPAVDECHRDQNQVPFEQPVLERRDERGRRESRELLPYAAVNRRRELDDPRADRERQRGNRRGRRVLGHRSKRDGERNRQAGIEYLTDRDDDELWPHDAATVARPKRDRHERSPQGETPAHEQHDHFRPHAEQRRERTLQFQLEGTALAIAGHQANGNEWEQEDGGDFKGAEGRAPHPDEWIADGAATAPAPALISANERTPSMKHTPTSGPISASMSHHAREAMSSRHSLSKSHATADLRKSEEDIFEIARGDGDAGGRGRRRQLVACADATDAPFAEQHKSIADPPRVSDLVNGQEQRAPAGSVRAQRRGQLAVLSQIQAVEGLVDQQRPLWRQQANRECDALTLALGQCPDRRGQQLTKRKLLDDLVAPRRCAIEEPDDEVEGPANGLCRPWCNAVRHVEEMKRTLVRL